MGYVLLGLFIGATVVYYFKNQVFRHGTNCFLLFFFRIPVKILEFIDSVTCQSRLNTPSDSTFETPILDTKKGYIHNTNVAQDITPKTTEKPVEPKPKKSAKPENIQSFRTPEGKQTFQMDDDSLINEWLSKNPDLKVE